jgi:hypothetical protein
MTDPIDRALDRLCEAEGLLWDQHELAHAILTDLVAEIEEKHCPDPGFCVASERLAAVTALGEEWLKSDTMGVWGDHLLALARGESQSIASRNDTKEEELLAMVRNHDMRATQLSAKLAAVRAYNARCRERDDYPDPVQLDAILDGKKAEDQ